MIDYKALNISKYRSNLKSSGLIMFKAIISNKKIHSHFRNRIIPLCQVKKFRSRPNMLGPKHEKLHNLAAVLVLGCYSQGHSHVSGHRYLMLECQSPCKYVRVFLMGFHEKWCVKFRTLNCSRILIEVAHLFL